MLSTDQVIQFVALWGGELDTLVLANTGVHQVYRFECNGRVYYLRLCDWPKWTVAIEYLHFLHQRGAPVCAPVASHAGRYTEELYFNKIQYQAVVVKAVPGERLGSGVPSLAAANAWGRALAQLHQTGQQFRPSAPLYSHDGVWNGEVMANAKASGGMLWQEWQTIDRFLQRLPRHADGHCWGWTHQDMRPGNVFYDGSQAWIIDFDEPTEQWFISDIARAMLEYLDRPRLMRLALRDAFVAGYRQQQPLPDDWLVLLPLFMRMRVVMAVAWSVGESGTVIESPLAASAPALSESQQIFAGFAGHLGQTADFEF
jgi:Ser/Thr protein kinase RdoA (MazF antagonist)